MACLVQSLTKLGEAEEQQKKKKLRKNEDVLKKKKKTPTLIVALPAQKAAGCVCPEPWPR